MRKEKKRPRVTLSDGESDENLGSRQSRKGSGEQKRKRVASPEVEEEKIVGRKKTGRGAGSGRRPAGDRRGRKLSFVDPYAFSDDVEVDMRKTMARTLKCHRKRTREDGNERKRNRVDSYALREDAAVERNNVNVEDWKDGEENDDSKGVRALSSRHLGSMTGQRDAETECSRSSNSLLELERNQGVGWFDKKVFRVDKVNSFRLAGMSNEKPSVSTDKAIRLQGKGGVLKVLPKAKMKVEGIERTPNGRATEDGRRRLGSSIVPNQKVVTPPPVSGGKNLLEKSPLTMSKNSKTEKRKAREMEKESPGVCSRMESKNTHGNSVQKSDLKSEVDSPSRLEGTPSSSYKERDDSPHTEKQLLRAEIRNMLVSAGWSIDYRPRRTKNYQDAVYVSPTGTTYWSIVNAYYAFQEEVNTGKDNSGRNPLFSPLSEEVLSLLTRKRTRKVSGKLDKKFGKLKFVAQEGKLLKPRKGSAGGLKSKKDGEGSLDVLNETLEPSFEPDVHYLQGKKGKKHVRCALLVRSSNKGARESNGEGVLHARKQTVLSWLVDSGTVSVNSKVQYMNRRHTRALLDGWVTRDGIHCSCCSKIVTASKFEIHAGSKLRQPFQNIILETGTSLLQCQLDAWDKQVESKRSGFHFVDTDGDDPDDDTCGICGDGGDLICCDGCPSTFHQHCLNLQKLPPGDWHCYGCTCKFCGSVESSTSQGDGTTVSPLLTCRQCEQKYHQDLTCIQEVDAAPFDSKNLYTSFCGHSCRKLFRRLHKLLGVKNDLEGEFSWTLIRRFDEKSATSSHALSKKADCNSKLAVALAVMDECFLPIIDRRSGINLIHSVLYSCGSNFNRLNYSGFYTVVLERDDEILSAACIRIHGTKLAEMPLIGTRHIYRRQGMCRRLLTAIELALCSLNVEKLIIPAISELMHTWTDVFGFKPLEESHRHEIRYMNMMVFPGADLLQKQLRKRDFVEGKTATDDADADAVVSATESSHHDAPDDTSLVDSSVGPHLNDSDINEEQETVNAADPCEASGGSKPEVMVESLDAPDGSDFQASGEGTVCNTSQLQDLSREGASDASDEMLFHHADISNHDKTDMKNKFLEASPIEKSFQSYGEGEQGQDNKVSVEVCGTENADINKQEIVNATEPCEASGGSKPEVMVESLDAPDGSDFQASAEGTICNTSQLQDQPSEGASDEVLFHHVDVAKHDQTEMKNKCLVASTVEESFQSSGEGEQGQDNKVSVEVCGIENADINEEQETVNAAEPCEPSGGSNPEVMDESLDASDGSDFQASGEVTVYNTSQLQDQPSGGASDEVVFHHADVPKHDKIDMKNECLVASTVEQSFLSSGEGERGQDNKVSVEACGTEIRTLVASSMDPCLNDADVNEVQETIIAAEDSNQACGGSIAEVMLERLDAPDVSGFCTPGKENVCNNSVLREKSSEVFVFHVDESHHRETVRGNQLLAASLVEPSIQSPGECGPAYTHGYQVPVEVCNIENTSLVASFVGPCLDNSDKNEVQETVPVAEVSKQACTGSDAEVMHGSLDVLDGSGFQTSGEGTVCNYRDLQDKSIECTSEKVPLHCADESRHDEAEAGNQSLSFQSSGECEPGSTHDSQGFQSSGKCEPGSTDDSQVSVEVCSMEHTSLVTSSLGPCLDDSDKNEIQETVPVAEPSNQACTGSHTEVMHGSLDVLDGSDFQNSGEGTVCNFTDLQVQSIEYTSEKEFLHHADESHHDKTEAGNQSLSLQSSSEHEASNIHVSQNRSAVSSFVGPHLDDSFINELQETVPVAEPSSCVCSGSNAEVMHNSLDVPDGSGFETSGEGALCDNANLQDKSDKCISEEVFLHQAEHHYKAEVENQSPVASPIGLSLQSIGEYELSMHDNCQACVEIHANDHKCASDIKEVKDIKSCEVSTAGVVLESLDVPDGCSVQPCEGTVCNNSKPQDKSIECASQKVFLHHSDVSHHNKVEMENQSPIGPAEPSLQYGLSRVVSTHETHVCVEVRGAENMSPVASTVEPHLCDSDRYEVQETVAAAEPCPQACGGSIDEMMIESFDVPDGSGFPTSCEGTACDKSGQQDQFSECASGKVFLHGPDVSLHGKTEIENQSPVAYHIESGLQSSSECELGNAHDNDLSVEADNVENSPVASSIGPSCNDSDIQEVQDTVTGAEPSNRASGGSNVELTPDSLDVPDRSGFQTLQEAVSGAEPSSRACCGSNAEVMPDSLDVSDRSGFQTSDEVTICNGPEPHDKSGECASEKEFLCHDETMMENQSLVASPDELNVQSSVGFELGVQESHEVCVKDCSTENTSLLPSLGPHPHGSDGSEVEQTDASSEPINDVCEGSTVDVVLEPLNVPYGSNFQTFGEGTACDNSKTQDKSSECASEKVFIHHADASGHDKTEKENLSPAVSPVQPSAQSSGPHVINSDLKELEDRVTAAEPGNQACCGSNAEVTPDSLDVPDGSGFQTFGLSVCNISELQDKSNGCASEKDLLHHADASHYGKMESESPGAAAVKPSLQSSGACELGNARDDQICVEVCSIENTSPVASSMGLQLHNSDMNEGIDGAVEPSSNACDGSTADVLETLDAPHGSCFQTPQGFVCNNAEPLVESSECSSEKAFLDHSDISDHDKTKVENQFHISSPVEPNLQSFVDAGLCSTHDELVIVDDCSVESNAHTFVEATGGCSADEPRISASGASSVLSVVTDPERTEILIKSTNLNPNLQETGEAKVDAIYEVKVTPVEPDACNLDEGSVPSTSDVTTELPVSASGYYIQASSDNTVHHELEIIAQPPCNAFDNQPSGECSVQLELVSKSPLNHSGTVLVLPSDTVHHNAQEVTDKSLLSSGDEPNLDSSSEGMQCSTHEVNADMTLSECNSHASGEGYVPSNSETASTSLNAAGESEHQSFDECRSSEAVYKACDSSRMSSPDPNMDCCKTIEDAKETNADCPVVSTPCAAGEEGTVPGTKGVESVEANHHSSVEVSASSMPNVTNEPKDAASCISFQVTDIANPCDSGLLCNSSGSSLGAVQHDLPMTNKSAPTSPV